MLKTVGTTHFLDETAPLPYLIPTGFSEADWSGQINNAAIAQILDQALVDRGEGERDFSYLLHLDTESAA